jgi:glucose-1-phosphate adenylyltransferase
MSRTVVMLLAGGIGSRLNVLVEARAKPAVPFGGIYRLIDFTLSNIMNSGLERVGILTQYKPLSLMSHIGSGEAWDFEGRTRGIKILPPHTGRRDSDWYKGTADALRQNMDYLTRYDPEQILILSGDHIYYMDYTPMINLHRAQKADLTVAMMEVPLRETIHFGTGIVNGKGRIVDWEEKPKKPRSNLASLGIYVFRTDYLLDALRVPQTLDFGKDLIPLAVKKDRVLHYPFTGYWRDVGTLAFYFEAHQDLLNPASGLNPEAWGTQSNPEEEGLQGDRSPVIVHNNPKVNRCIISNDTLIEGQVIGSILSPGVRIGKGARVLNSVLMHDCQVEPGAFLNRVIMDKKGRVGRKAYLNGQATLPNREFPEQLHEGLLVIGKGATIPAGIQLKGNTIIYPWIKEKDFSETSLGEGATIKPKALTAEF